MKVALLTDTHFGVRNDAAVMLDYQERFYSEVFFPFLRKNAIAHIIHLGDLVDRRKYINYLTSSRMRSMFFEPMDQGNITCDLLIGNHDTTFKNTNDVNALRELVEGKWNNVNLFEDTATVKKYGRSLCYVPWITPENRDRTLKGITSSDARYCFGHLELKGFLDNDRLPVEFGDDPSIFKKFDAVYSGHFHNKMSGGNVTYLGCPYEMTWSDFNDQKGFHTFDVDTGELQFIKNPYTLFNKFVYNDEKYTLDQHISILMDAKNTFCKVYVEAKKDPYLYDRFLDELEKIGPFDLKIVEQKITATEGEEGELSQIDTADTISYIHGQIDATEMSVDKAKVKVLLSRLYNSSNTAPEL